VSDAEEVLRTLVLREVEVRSESGAWFLARLLPYRTADNIIDGVVVNFIDITKVKALVEREQRILRALDHSPTTVFAHGVDLAYVLLSGGIFGRSRETAIGKTDRDLLPEADADRLTTVKRQVLQDNQSRHDRVELASTDGRRTFDIYLEANSTDGEGVELIGSITER
jgi:two-component system, chemotaxis family, CheB/CheR fusion protein